MIYLNTCCCDEHVVFNVQYDEGTPSSFTLHSSQMVEFIKNLQREDEVTVTLHTGQQKICPRIFSSQRNYKTPPFPYQQQGIDYGLSGHNNWLLLDAPGLGKTLQLTYLAKELKERQGLQHCLIICGINTLKTNWKNEIEKHSNLSCRILGQRITKKGNFVVDGIQERLKQLKEPIDEFFVITNVETLREDKIVQAILKNKYNKFDMIVVDEVHRCLDENTIIETDRGMYTIGEIVRNKLTCKVKSYDESKERICMSDVTNWYQNSCVTSMLELTFEDELGVTHTLNCTDNHLIYTYNRGYVKAKDLTEEDIVNIGTQ